MASQIQEILSQVKRLSDIPQTGQAGADEEDVPKRTRVLAVESQGSPALDKHGHRLERIELLLTQVHEVTERNAERLAKLEKRAETPQADRIEAMLGRIAETVSRSGERLAAMEARDPATRWSRFEEALNRAVDSAATSAVKLTKMEAQSNSAQMQRLESMV